jgi:pyruvate/2-oxoglutarate dehydrogenase complex dihydrolipoamide acyltransferase (E2) component
LDPGPAELALDPGPAELALDEEDDFDPLADFAVAAPPAAPEQASARADAQGIVEPFDDSDMIPLIELPSVTAPAQSSAPSAAGQAPDPDRVVAVEAKQVELKQVEPKQEVTQAPAPKAAAKPAAARRAKSLAAALVGLVAVAAIGVPFMARSRGAAAAAPAATPSAAPPAAAPARKKSPATGVQKWSSENRASWVGTRRHATAFELRAENIVPIWMNQVRPTLVVRCIAGKVEVFVLTGSALKIEPQTEEHTVRVGLDDAAVASALWPDSAEHDALFAPDGAAMLSKLQTAYTLRFGYTPHNASPVTAVFNVAGLSPLLAPAAGECGVKR